jgi:hypothetical protein
MVDLGKDGPVILDVPHGPMAVTFCVASSSSIDIAPPILLLR